jgi:hypothetical protein
MPHDTAGALTIRPVSPFRLDLTVWALRRRDYDAVNRTVAKWQPYAGLVYLHLLLDGLSKAGAFE